MYLIILLLSIWQSILFWNKTPGISVILFTLPFLIFLIKYLEQKGKIKNQKAKLIAIPIVLLSATYFIFNNQFLNSVNKLAIPVLIVLMTIELICDKFTLEKIISNILNFIFKPIGYFGSVIKNIIAKIKKEESTKPQKPKNLKRIVKAIIISIPLLLLVFILLVTADKEFSKLFVNIVEKIFRIIEKIKLSNIWGRIVVIILTFFYIAGFIENIILTNDIKHNKKEIKSKDSLTIKFILTMLNVIYLIFCIIQVKSMFSIYSMNKNNISYAYYARQGFFQLMLVSAINLIMILKSKKDCYNKEKYITIMDVCMIVLTALILIFSFVRMYLYQQTFGFTLKRILVFWAQITEGILLVPTTIYVLNKKIDLAKLYFIIVVSMYVILNFANINKIIAKKNVNMYLERKSVSSYDINELTKLGTDTVSEVIRTLDLLSEQEAKEIENINKFREQERSLGHYVYEYEHKDVEKYSIVKNLNKLFNNINNEKTTWQEFNISKIRAKKLLRENIDLNYLEK